VDYQRFCDQGEERWRQLGQALDRSQREGLLRLGYEELERTVSLHRQVVSDFAFARSRYSGTSVERRLRALSFAGHRLLGERPGPLRDRLGTFFARTFPATLRAAWASLGVSAAIFTCAALAGFSITLANESFAALFLGSQAFSELRDGVIWTDRIASAAPPAVLASGIFTNNISVALMAWIGGALFGLGTVYLLVTNGLMLGTVISVVWQYGLLDVLLRFISTHGALEILLILVAGSAGIELARGLLCPADRDRAAARRLGARRAFRIVGGALPWLVLAGIVEGFVSPQPQPGVWTKLTIGLALVGSFAAYVLLCGRQAR